MTLRLETPRGGRTNPQPPTPAKVTKHGLRARVKERDGAVSGRAANTQIFSLKFERALSARCALSLVIMKFGRNGVVVRTTGHRVNFFLVTLASVLHIKFEDIEKCVKNIILVFFIFYNCLF